jgi:hypothetical protein
MTMSRIRIAASSAVEATAYRTLVDLAFAVTSDSLCRWTATKEDATLSADSPCELFGRAQLDLGRLREAEVALRFALETWSTENGTRTAWYAQARALLGRTLDDVIKTSI